MSDTSNEPTEGEGQEGGDPNIKILRDKAKRTDEAETALAQATRRIAVLESGIDVESPVGELFLKAYDGEVTPEAMKEAAAKYGVPLKGQAPSATGEGEVDGEGAGGEGSQDPPEPTGTAERRALSDGAPADTGEDKDPRQTSIDVFNEAMKAGLPEDDAQAASLGVLATAAIAGDKRVIYDPTANRRAAALRELQSLGE